MTALGKLLNRVNPPVPLASDSRMPLRGITQTGPFTDQMEAMTSSGTLFAVINRTSNATSQVEWRLWRSPRSGRSVDRTEVNIHAAIDLWEQPNEDQPRQQFVEGFQQHIDLTGETYWVIGRAQGSDIPLEMWYLRPDRMAVVVGPGGIKGYIHRGPNGERTPLTKDQVISLIQPSPLDLFRGLGAAQSITTELDTYRFTAEWNRQFFRNSAQPEGVIEVERNMSDEEWERFRLRWQETHRGMSNAHRVAMLEGGMTWKNAGQTMRDMQFTQLREVSRDTIREAYAFPKPMLGAVDDVNRANAEAGEWLFARWVLVPRLERIKQALNHELLPLFGVERGELFFDYDSPLPKSTADERMQLEANSLALERYQRAGYDPDDILEALDLPRMDHIGTLA